MKRVHVSFPDPIHETLAQLAVDRGQPIATVAAILVELYLEQQKVFGHVSHQNKPLNQEAS